MKMCKARWLPSLLLPLLASCATGPAPNDFCLLAQPIRPSMAEIAVLTPETSRQILTYDRTGARLCGWKPGGS